MLGALVGVLLVASSPAPVTSLDATAPEPDPLPAGAEIEHPVTVQLEGPAGAMPGLAGPVNVTLEAPDEARCSAPDEVFLDPVTGRTEVPVTCRPRTTGAHPIELAARSAPHAPGSWNGTLLALPDALVGDLAVGGTEDYEVPIDLDLAPEHLDDAEANVTVTGQRLDTGLGFLAEQRHVLVDEAWSLDATVPALHGPGRYAFQARATGPNVEPFQARDTVEVPAPAEQGAVELNVTVDPGEPSVALASESVNADGVNKRPGDTLYTRLVAEHADEVNVTVLRPTGEEDVRLSEATLPVDADGRAEHTFRHPILPAGLLRVQATAGESSVARTAQIQDLEADAHVELPTSVLGDGRPARGTIELEDPNHGSTPEDPAPVWGLPDLTWTVYRGSIVAQGFEVSIGPFEGPAEGRAQTSTIPWPDGTSWARVGDGWARTNLTVTPPQGVDSGSYRFSAYAPDGDRIGGDTVEVQAPPSLALEAPEPVPGSTWPVNASVQDAVPGTEVEVTVLVEGRAVANRTVPADGTARVELPVPLSPGATVTAQAVGDWPGRPTPAGPDAVLEGAIEGHPPVVRAHPVLDGAPTAAPVAVHPDHAHELVVRTEAWDPNGHPVSTTAKVLAPDGNATGWAREVEAGPIVEVPSKATAGRYEVHVTAESQDGTSTTSFPLDVGAITRLRVDGPGRVALEEGDAATVNLTVRNAGTVQVERVLARVQAPDALDVAVTHEGRELALDEPANLTLEPGATRSLEATLGASLGATGTHEARITLAGVHP